MGFRTCLLTCRIARMDAADAAAFWLVRADSRGLSRHERAVFDTWRRDSGNADALQAISLTFALLGPALRDRTSGSLAGQSPPSPPKRQEGHP